MQLTQTDVSVGDEVAHRVASATWGGAHSQSADVFRQDRPRIGLLTSLGTTKNGAWPIYGGDAATVHALLEAGGLPVLIPTPPQLLTGNDPWSLLTDEQAFTAFFRLLWPLIRELDGLVFAGGGDLCPSLYGQTLHPESERPDVWRDLWERSFALLAWHLCLPTLGICRGMQLLNVALGGTLYQDLPTQWLPECLPLLRHRAPGQLTASNWVDHPIQLLGSQSRLAQACHGTGGRAEQQLTPPDRVVLSMHHQAVETLAPGLAVTAIAPDGIIEAVEEATPSSRWWVGTQFHPEWMTELAWVRALFAAFIAASRHSQFIARQDRDQSRDALQHWLYQQELGRSPRSAQVEGMVNISAAKASLSFCASEPGHVHGLVAVTRLATDECAQRRAACQRMSVGPHV